MTTEKIRFGFAGFRHSHIFGLLRKVQHHPGCEVAAMCEEDTATADQLAANPEVSLTHHSYAELLRDGSCNVIAIGDYYGKRGKMAIQALANGCHVIADKPLCTHLEELNEIQRLSRAGGLAVGCMLDLRDHGQIHAARQLIAAGQLGRVLSIQCCGQHPLLFGSRPGWYFENGKHGGTLNDIAIHALDLVQFLTGETIRQLDFARSWNAKAPEPFRDGAQFALRLANGAGVLGDVSYFAPDSCGYQLPYYWRFTVWASRGVMEFQLSEAEVSVTFAGDTETRRIPPASIEQTYFDAFLAELAGKTPPLHSEYLFDLTRQTLTLEQMGESIG